MRTDVRREDRNGHKTRNARKVRNVNALQDQNPDRKETQIKRNRKIMKNLLRNSLFCLLGICLMAACNENTVYHSYQSLPDEGWGKSDTLSFLIPVTDSIPPTLRLFAEVRNRTDYPYHNLYLFISQNLHIRHGVAYPYRRFFHCLYFPCSDAVDRKGIILIICFI